MGESAVYLPFITVEVEMSRSKELSVNPDFVKHFAGLPVRERADPSRRVEGGFDYKPDGVSPEAFEEAFENYSLKCAVSRKNDLGELRSGPAKVWAVNFGESWISHLAVESGWPQVLCSETALDKIAERDHLDAHLQERVRALRSRV